LASIQFAPREPSDHDLALASAIANRKSDRRPMNSWPVDHRHVVTLISAAARNGAFLQPLDNPMDAAEWGRLSAEVASQRADDPGVQKEIDRFSRQLLPSDEASDGSALSPEVLSWSGPSEANRQGEASAAVPLLLATSSDDRLAELRAGEALSAVLLEATRLGLATRLDSQAVESRRTREVVESDLLGGTRSPQILVIVGWPVGGAESPDTERRPVRSTLKVVDADSMTHHLGHR
jgi:hypothetical protein